MKYRKKPVVIEAFCFGKDFIPDWFMDKVSTNDIILRAKRNEYRGDLSRAEITTLEGKMIANYGDFVIKGVKGEIYPCKPDIFHATYDKAEDYATPNVLARKGRSQ